MIYAPEILKIDSLPRSSHLLRLPVDFQLAPSQVISKINLIWVDQGFNGENLPRVMHSLRAVKVDVICRTEPGFHVLPKRWIVEQTFG